MKYYEEWLSRVEYAKSMHAIYGFEKHLYDNELFFRKFMSMGYQNVWSYYSVVCHERYYKELGDKKLFVSRDGGPYYFECSHEIDLNLAFIFKEVPSEQHSPFHFSIKMFSNSLLEQIDKAYFV